MIDPRLPEPKMRDEFRSELRARLMREAVIALAPRPRGSAWTFLRPAAGVGLAGVLLISGAGTAAASSVAGDAAFPLKKAFEDIQVTLTLDDVQRVELLGEIADRRLAELQTVADRADESRASTASDEFASALARFRAAVDKVQQAAPGDKSEKVQKLVDAARGKHEAALDEVQKKLDSPTANDAIERARDEEDKDTESENKNNNDPKKTERPGRTPTPARTPRGAETPRATGSPRATERPESTRPASLRPEATATPRFAPTPRASGDQMDDRERPGN